MATDSWEKAGVELFVGSYFIATQHGGRTRSQVLQLAVDRLFSESGS